MTWNTEVDWGDMKVVEWKKMDMNGMVKEVEEHVHLGTR